MKVVLNVVDAVTDFVEHVGKDIVLYDGTCALCESSVQFILPRDRSGRFHFASLQSAFAKDLLAKLGRQSSKLDTSYVVRSYGTPAERLLDRSEAAFYVLSHLDGMWRFFGLFKIIPKTLANPVYDVLARSRHSIFGKHERCSIVDPAFSARFIER